MGKYGPGTETMDALAEVLTPIAAAAELACWKASATLMEQRALRSEARYERLLRRYVALKAQRQQPTLEPPQPAKPRPLDASAP